MKLRSTNLFSQYIRTNMHCLFESICDEVPNAVATQTEGLYLGLPVRNVARARGVCKCSHPRRTQPLYGGRGRGGRESHEQPYIGPFKLDRAAVLLRLLLLIVEVLVMI